MKKITPKKIKSSPLEDLFEEQLKTTNLQVFTREYKFLENRKFRFDFADPINKIAIEIQGKIWQLSGHTSGYGLIRDAEKLALANLNGWTTFFVTEPQVKSGQGLKWILEYMNYLS